MISVNNVHSFCNLFFHIVCLIWLLECDFMSVRSNNKIVSVSFLFYIQFFQQLYFLYFIFHCILQKRRSWTFRKWKSKLSCTTDGLRNTVQNPFHIKDKGKKLERLIVFHRKNQLVLELDALRMLINIKLQSGVVFREVSQCVGVSPVLLKI